MGMPGLHPAKLMGGCGGGVGVVGGGGSDGGGDGPAGQQVGALASAGPWAMGKCRLDVT